MSDKEHKESAPRDLQRERKTNSRENEIMTTKRQKPGIKSASGRHYNREFIINQDKSFHPSALLNVTDNHNYTVCKLPSGVKPSMEHLNDFYLDERQRRIVKRLSRLPVDQSGREEGLLKDSGSRTNRLGGMQSPDISFNSSLKDDEFDSSSKLPKEFSNMSIDVIGEGGESSLKGSRISTDRRSISKRNYSRLMSRQSGAGTPLLNIEKGNPSKKDDNSDSISNHNSEDETQKALETKMKKLFSKKQGNNWEGPKSKFTKDSGYQSYWLDCITKCLEQKDLAKISKIGYNETLTNLPKNFCSKESRSPST